MNEVICLRCGCPMLPDERQITTIYSNRGSASVGEEDFVYADPQRHSSTQLCMVALRRKEIEAARKDQP